MSSVRYGMDYIHSLLLVKLFYRSRKLSLNCNFSSIDHYRMGEVLDSAPEIYLQPQTMFNIFFSILVHFMVAAHGTVAIEIAQDYFCVTVPKIGWLFKGASDVRWCMYTEVIVQLLTSIVSISI